MYFVILIFNHVRVIYFKLSIMSKNQVNTNMLLKHRSGFSLDQCALNYFCDKAYGFNLIHYENLPMQ